ncbi:hypothetical protein Hypma_004349 [Hypsizygus marmoreus]|uniref:Uncharacterized protein n=1 Tax=Hypsizygus marmoreus TaxID=39966 RepID=A0A369K421_HYPMA|nr:hypothetical protein Hypma_004349 [Hypsizygus marmoreus]
MSSTKVAEHVALESLPPVTENARRLFGSLAYLLRPPLHYLPSELLSEIFLIATHDTEDRYHALLTPISLSHVSSRWRHVALSTGGLWTNIILTFPVSRAQISCAVSWLRRSQSHPLDIFLDFRDPSWDWELAESSHAFRWQDMEAILRLLMTHVHRWNRFELLTDTWAPIYTFLCYTRRVESAPWLESISLSRCNACFASKGATFAPVEMREPIPLFGGLAFQKLREVSLSGVHIDWALSSLSNLTTLEFRYLASDVTPSLEEFVGILTECPNLQKLSIIGRGPNLTAIRSQGSPSSDEHDTNDIHAKIQPTIHLPHLKHFVFGFADTDYAAKLLSLFSAPLMEELTLEGFSVGLDLHEPHAPDATPILEWFSVNRQSNVPHTDFTVSSSTSLISLDRIRSLRLIGIKSDKMTFARLFDELQGLTHLGLFSTETSALLALMPPTSNGHRLQPPCPLLKKLESRDVDPDAFADLVLARQPIDSGAGLEKTCYEATHDLSSEDHAKLISAGVNIVFLNSESYEAEHSDPPDIEL